MPWLHRVFLCLVLSAWASPAWAAWAFVQFEIEETSGSASSVPLTFNSSVTAGSLLVCFTKSSTATATGTADDIDGAWAEIATGSPLSGNGRTASVWYRANATGGTTTVTTTFDASEGSRSMACGEYSGIATSSAFDVSVGQEQTNPGTGTDAVTSGATAAAAQANSLAVSCSIATSGSVVYTTTTGWTSRVNANCQGGECACEDINIASGTAEGTYTIDSSTEDTLTFTVIFKEPAAGGPPVGALVLSKAGT